MYKAILKAATGAALVFTLSANVYAQEETTTTTTTTETTEEVETTTGTERIIETREGSTITVIRPETKTTKVIPKKVVVREALDSFLAVGIRSSFDYHFQPKKAAISCLWIFGEIYGKHWGVELGLGRIDEPNGTYSDRFGTKYTGDGFNKYFMVDLMGKYYWWFSPRNWWVGAGLSYYNFTSGYMIFANSTVTAATDNPAAPTTAYHSYVDVYDGNKVYAQIGTGVRIALNAERLHFTPDIRFMYPLTEDDDNGIVMRLNAALTYDFPLD